MALEGVAAETGRGSVRGLAQVLHSHTTLQAKRGATHRGQHWPPEHSTARWLDMTSKRRWGQQEGLRRTSTEPMANPDPLGKHATFLVWWRRGDSRTSRGAHMFLVSITATCLSAVAATNVYACGAKERLYTRPGRGTTEAGLPGEERGSQRARVESQLPAARQRR